MKVKINLQSLIHPYIFFTIEYNGFFQLLVKGGGKMRLYGLLGVEYVSVCKACGKLGGSGACMLPCEILILGLLLGAIW